MADMNRAWLLGIVAVGACGGKVALQPPPGMTGAAGMNGVAPAVDFQDGTRLRFPVWRAPDGTVQRQGTILDTARDQACTPMKASDGKLRCLPGGGYDTKADTFADPACTQPLASGQGAAPPNGVALGILSPATGEACDRVVRWEVRQLDGLHTGSGFRLSDGSCVATGLSARETWYRTGAVLPPETFVAIDDGDIVAVKPDARISERRWRAEDGAWLRAGLFDTAEQRPCDEIVTSDGQVRCVPVPRFRLAGSSKGQADCGGPTLADQVACPADTADIVLSGMTCAGQYEVHAIGQPYQAAQRFARNDAGACVASPNFVGTVVPGAVIEPSRYASLEVVREGTGRLRHERYAHADGARAPTGWLYDTELHERCRFGKSPAGEILCHPPTMYGAFRDMECKQPVAVDTFPARCASDGEERFVTLKGKLYQLGARLAGPPAALFDMQGTEGRCLPSYLLFKDFAYYEVGAEVAVTLVAGHEG
jgi:hypothetical protein